MNALFVFASLVAVAIAAPSGHHGGAVLVGPSGVVTGHGAVGHAGIGWGGWGGWGGHGAVVAGPAVGWGVGLGHGAIGLGHHGVTVAGPGTVPATIAGPAGAITAHGLWGPTLAHGHGGHGHGW